MNLFSSKPVRVQYPFVRSLKLKARKFQNEVRYREAKLREEVVNVERVLGGFK